MAYLIDTDVMVDVSRRNADAADLVPYQMLAGPPRLKPSLKGRLGLAGPPACQEAFHADILVQVRPVYSRAAANETPLGSLRRGSVRQTREPDQRHRDCPAIRKIDHQRLVAGGYALSNGFPEFSSRNTHATPSPRTPCFRQQETQFAEAPCAQSHDSAPDVPDRAKTWPRIPPVPREREAVRLDPPNRRRTGMARIEELSATLPVYRVYCGLVRAREIDRGAVPCGSRLVLGLAFEVLVD